LASLDSTRETRMPTPPRTICFFGGSFDPIHVGHLAVAQAALTGGGFDELRFLPAGASPLKRHAPAPAEHRVAMIELALAGMSRLALDRRELALPGPSYTVDTMEAVHAEEPGAALAFLVGMDSLRYLPGWHRIERLAQIVSFVATPRPGVDSETALAHARAATGARIAELDTGPLVDVSSSDIRARRAGGRPITGLVPPAVEDWILRHDLYRWMPT
jgi:nicotinate-nucleotide adenylyltransferase